MKDRGYYIFWAAIALIMTTVMTTSIVGLQIWLAKYC